MKSDFTTGKMPDVQGITKSVNVTTEFLKRFHGNWISRKNRQLLPV